MIRTLAYATLLVLAVPAWTMDAAPATGTEPASPKPAAPAKSSATAKAGKSVRTEPAAAPAAQDKIELEATQITGNRELPRVLYVVPWKRADLGDMASKPVSSLMDDVLAPVDRDVFRRQNRYYQALKPDATGTGKSGGAEGEK